MRLALAKKTCESEAAALALYREWEQRHADVLLVEVDFATKSVIAVGTPDALNIVAAGVQLLPLSEIDAAVVTR